MPEPRADDGLQNDNKTLQDNLKHNGAAYDEKYAALLGKLEGIQEEKDHPRKQVVDIGVDTLSVTVALALFLHPG